MNAPRPQVRAIIGALCLLATTPLRAQVSRITPNIMAQRIGALAHDSMRGRATPGPEIEQAAAYVAGIFRDAGLMPAGDDGGFIQRYAIGAATAPNVVGIVPGRDARLAREYVIVVAHLDHIGVGRPDGGDSIRNGADDNASGSAGLLAMAEAFASGPGLRRSVLFLSASGEERGLLGSKWFAAHPTVRLGSVVGLVNLDMISRNTPDSVFLNGWGKSTISTLVERLAAEHRELGLSVGPDIEDRPQTPQDSDHWPFQHLGIPYIFFYTGEHPDYHRVGDEPAHSDADKAARVARLAWYTVEAIANETTPPAWDPEARRLNVSTQR